MTQPTVPGGYLLDTNGTVTVGVRSLPTNFNPSSPAGDNRITQMVMEQVWPQPFITDPTFGISTSGLLESAEVQSISPLTVVYVLNPAAVWSDGHPITAADFAYSWHQHVLASSSLPDSGLVAGYRDIASVVGSNGGSTVTVTFSQPFSQWQALFANLVPAHVAQRYGWSAAFAGYSPSHVISGGPFEVSSYTPGRELVLTRNPRYWGIPAHVARIRFVLEKSESAIVAGLRSGALSVAEVNASAREPGAVAPGLVGNGSVASTSVPARASGSSRSSGLAWTGVAASQIWQLCFNFYDPIMSQLSIRRGIEHSLDRSEIVADSEGLIDPRIGVAISRLTLAGESTNPSAAGTSPVVQRAPALYKPHVALSFFSGAGYIWGAGGLLRPGGIGLPLAVTLLEPKGYWAVDRAGAVIQAELRSIGLSVDIVRKPLSTMLSTTLPQGDYEMALAPFGVSPTFATMAPDYTNPVLPQANSGSTAVSTALSSGVTSVVSSGPRPSGSRPVAAATGVWGTNVPVGTEPGAVAAGSVTRDVLGINEPAISRHFTQALGELNLPTAFGDLQKAEARMWNQVVSIPLFQSGFDLVRSLRIDNVSESPTWAGLMWDAEDWAILKHVPKTTTTTTGAGG